MWQDRDCTFLQPSSILRFDGTFMSLEFPWLHVRLEADVFNSDRKSTDEMALALLDLQRSVRFPPLRGISIFGVVGK